MNGWVTATADRRATHRQHRQLAPEHLMALAPGVRDVPSAWPLHVKTTSASTRGLSVLVARPTRPRRLRLATRRTLRGRSKNTPATLLPTTAMRCRSWADNRPAKSSKQGRDITTL